MPADIKSAPASHRVASLEGMVFTCQSEQDRVEAIDKAFDYRGHASPPHLQMFIKGSDTPRIIPYADIDSIAFTGKDTANGKSWEAWVNKKASERKAEADRIAAEAAAQGHL
jgi:hypothetical protein